MEELGIEDARRQLGEIVDKARLAGHPTMITRQGKPAAVVINVNWYDQLKELLQQGIAEVVAEAAAGAGKEINHRDGDPRDNDPSNLEIRDAPETTQTKEQDQ